MAGSNHDDVNGLVEILANLPAFDVSNSRTFDVSCEEESIRVEITASSSREGAIKFGLLLKRLDDLRSSEGSTKKITISDADSHLKELYDVMIINGNVFVELVQILEQGEANGNSNKGGISGKN